MILTAAIFGGFISFRRFFILNAIVLSSGGLDSTTCLAIAVNKFSANKVAALSISYGQRHVKELDAARHVAQFYHVQHYQLDITNVFRYSESALLNSSDAELGYSSYAEQIRENPRISTYVPFRNGVMLSMAAAFSDSIFKDEIELYIGVHSDDFAGHAYADCSAQFVAAMSAAVRIGTYDKIHIVAPFLCQSKADVVKVGLELGAPYHLTWSCYERSDIPCGKCATCIDRARAFEINGVDDPALRGVKNV